MAQGIFGGATSYEEQSLADIMEDLEKWTEYTLQTKAYISECHTKLLENKFWEKIPVDFQMTIISTIRFCDTIVNDIKLVKKAIQKDYVTNKEVTLLKKIGQNSVNFNHEYGITYKKYDRWKDYGNPDFIVAEKVYAKGRDFFVTLQDAHNAAERLKDYMEDAIIKNSINIGGNVVNSPIQQGKENIITTNNYTIDMTKQTRYYPIYWNVPILRPKSR